MSGLVFTAALDVPPPPPPLSPGEADWKCFRYYGDTPATPPWETAFVYPNGRGPTLQARDIKWGWERRDEYPWSIWVDSKYRFDAPPESVLKHVPSTAGLAVFRHPFRGSIYGEIRECERLGHISSKEANRYIDTLRLRNYGDPRAICVHTTGFLFRRPSDHNTDIGADILSWLEEFSHTRDQLHFNVLVRKHIGEAHLLPGHYHDNPFATWHKDWPKPHQIAVLTPTGDRPWCLNNLARYINRQTVQPCLWVIVDDGHKRSTVDVDVRAHTVCVDREPKHSGTLLSLAKNVHCGLDSLGDLGHEGAVAIMEDDDWYGPDHLKRVLDALRSGARIVGTPAQDYYHVPSRRYVRLPNVGSCLASTAFRGSLIPLVQECCKQDSEKPGLDRRIWERCRELSITESNRTQDGETLGLKGLPGRKGLGIGHTPERLGDRWTEDTDGSWLRDRIGNDAERYLDVSAGV